MCSRPGLWRKMRKAITYSSLSLPPFLLFFIWLDFFNVVSKVKRAIYHTRLLRLHRQSHFQLMILLIYPKRSSSVIPPVIGPRSPLRTQGHGDASCPDAWCNASPLGDTEKVSSENTERRKPSKEWKERCPPDESLVSWVWV